MSGLPSRLRAATWNARSLRSLFILTPDLTSKRRRSRRIKFLYSLAASHKVVFLQEANADVSEQDLLSSKLVKLFPNWRFFFNLRHANVAGTVTMVHEDLLTNCNAHQVVQVRGYVSTLYFDGEEEAPLNKVSLSNIYMSTYNAVSNMPLDVRVAYDAPNSIANRFETKLTCVESLTDIDRGYCNLLGGDWNFVENESQVMHMTSHYKLSDTLRDTFLSSCDKLSVSTVEQGSFTRFGRSLSLVGYNAAVLDRWMLGSTEADLTGMSVKSYISPSAKDNPSDHLPVTLDISLSATPGRRFTYKIPNWVLKDADTFRKIFANYWNASSYQDDPYDELNIFKRCAVKTSKHIIKWHRTAATEETTKLEVMIKLHRAIVLKVPQVGVSLARNHPFLLRFQRNDGSFHDESLKDEINKLLLDSDLAYGGKNGGNACGFNFFKKAKMILPSNRSRITGMRGSLGCHDLRPTEMSGISKSFWDGVWRSSPFNDNAFAEVMAGYGKKIVVDADSITEEMIDAAIKMTNDSTSGPDGVPYRVYRILAGTVSPILSKVARKLATEVSAPGGFNHALLYLLEKKPSGLPEDTRPLSVTNADNRIIAIALKNVLHDPIKNMINARGIAFIRGNKIGKHVNDVNSSYYEHVRKKKLRLYFFLDFRKAYDSVLHSFILKLLKEVDMPEWVVNMVTHLLEGVRARMTFPFDEHQVIDIFRGVKQGCPLSPLLFNVIIDVLVEMLVRVPDSEVRGQGLC